MKTKQSTFKKLKSHHLGDDLREIKSPVIRGGFVGGMLNGSPPQGHMQVENSQSPHFIMNISGSQLSQSHNRSKVK